MITPDGSDESPTRTLSDLPPPSSATRPWAAALWTFLFPGLGHLYVRFDARYLLFFAFPTFLLFIAHGALRAGLPAPVAYPCLMALRVIYLSFLARGAYRLAKYGVQNPAPRFGSLRQRLVVVFFASLGLISLAHTRAFAALRIERPDMAWTPGSWVMIEQRPWGRSWPVEGVARGEPVVIWDSAEGSAWISRVIGLPGDRVELEGYAVSVNGNAIATEPSSSRGATHERLDGHAFEASWDWSRPSPTLALTVPQGQVFVLSDRRAYADDSRRRGTIPIDRIVAKPRFSLISR